MIDLGSSCFITDHLSSYVQSRSYRAPEVILGLPYGQKIDIWSLGCILAELATGYVLFQVGGAVGGDCACFLPVWSLWALGIVSRSVKPHCPCTNIRSAWWAQGYISMGCMHTIRLLEICVVWLLLHLRALIICAE